MSNSPAFSRRSVLKGFGALAGGAALAACSSGGGSAAPAKVTDIKPGTLTIMSPTGEIAPESDRGLPEGLPPA